MKTGVITFNVRERGRQFRGQKRNFDTAALAAVINGSELQEQVRNRDLLGYFGHWPRVMFGMTPGEGGIHAGKQITLEPALVTTRIRADADGNIEHEAEFLDTAPGRTAARMFGSRAGGFSSAINCRELHGRDVPISFHGFDYVTEPNFTTNRGYVLDGVAVPGDAVVLDAALAESAMTVRVLDGLYSRLQGDYNNMASALQRMQQENEELVAMLSRAGRLDDARQRIAALDSAAGFRIGAGKRGAGMESLAKAFDSAALAGFEAQRAEPDAGIRVDDAAGMLGFGR